MKFCLLLIFVFAYKTQALSQTIVGQVIDYITQEPLLHVNVYVNASSFNFTNSNGDFTIILNKKFTTEDTMKIMYISYYDINFINLPTDLDTLNLKTIPLFEYFTGSAIADFFCGPLDFNCKRERKIFWQKENKRLENYYDAQNLLISEYRFHFNGDEYQINLENHCIDLSKKK